MTHGSKNHRNPGSIGMGTTPGRVIPGKRMAGQLGNKNANIKKLKISIMISKHAKIGRNVEIGNYVVIEDGVEIGD